MSKVKAAGLFLVNTEDKILVGHPTKHHPDFWSIPKGKIDEGETPLDAAIRETYEESNFKLFKKLHDFIEIGKFTYRHKKKDIMIFAHFEKEEGYWDNIVIQCNSNVPEDRGGFPEMDAFKWVTIDEARTILHKTQIDALDVLEEKIDSRRNGDMLWCDDCLDFVYHRTKLSAANSGYLVCNRCDVMNPVCTLIKETNSAESHFMKTSLKVTWLEFGKDRKFKDRFDEPAIGRSLLMDPFNDAFTWQTTPIVEIIEEKNDKPRKYIKFRTENSIYELFYHKL